jgi:hypothetical protein
MARKKITRIVPDANARHLWLAGLGLAVMAGRTTVQTATQAVDLAVQARRQAIAAVGQAQSKLIETAGEVRDQIGNGVAQASQTIESVLAPLMAKFKPGKAKRATRRGRKPVAKKNVRRTAKKVAGKRARKA